VNFTFFLQLQIDPKESFRHTVMLSTIWHYGSHSLPDPLTKITSLKLKAGASGLECLVGIEVATTWKYMASFNMKIYGIIHRKTIRLQSSKAYIMEINTNFIQNRKLITKKWKHIQSKILLPILLHTQEPSVWALLKTSAPEIQHKVKEDIKETTTSITAKIKHKAPPPLRPERG